MHIYLTRWWLWVAVNLAGIAAFFHFAVPTWIEPELAKEPGASGGDAIVWGVTALPILLLFILLHLIFGIAAHRQRIRNGSWRSELLGGLTLLGWIGVTIFDAAHHGM